MGKICIDATNATTTELHEVLRVAKEVANNLHRTVTVYTSTGNLEVDEDEEEEKDVKYKKEKSQSR